MTYRLDMGAANRALSPAQQVALLRRLVRHYQRKANEVAASPELRRYQNYFSVAVARREAVILWYLDTRRARS